VSRIEDPFLGFNELKCEWVAQKDWTYRVRLPAFKAGADGTRYCLVFEGLDTYATVELNGEVVFESDNMWIVHRIDVTQTLLSSGKENVLKISFRAALPEAQKIKAAHPEHKWVGFNADMARLAVRKAQYHFVSTTSTSSRLEWNGSQIVLVLTIILGMGLGTGIDHMRTVASGVS
jgi:beta-mannosidase